MPRRSVVDATLEFIRETDKAICVTEDGGTTQIWLPKSQIEYEVLGTVVEVTLPLWLASEKKLAGY